MKRLNNLHSKICTKNNVELADDKARLHKKNNWGIIKHDRHRESDNIRLLQQLTDLTYETSQYSTFKIYEPKERIIFRLPYYPDRIAHHSIMNIMEPIWVNIFIKNTYSCIKERGIHKLAYDLRKALDTDREGTSYCLKLDIKKFYPSIDHNTLKRILRKKIKDKSLLKLLDGIVDSSDGVPIGNYLSQFFANLVLAYFDHWIKEEVKVKYYFRYADDIVILSNNKEFLRKVLILIKLYLKHELNLTIKSNYQVFLVSSRGIDFVGYKFFHTHTLLRKDIKQRLKRTIFKYKRGKLSIEELRVKLSSYFGWLKYCNSKHLLQYIEKETGLHYSNWKGIESKITLFKGKRVHVVDIMQYSKYFKINFVYKGKYFTVKSRNRELYTTVKELGLPLNMKLIK